MTEFELEQGEWKKLKTDETALIKSLVYRGKTNREIVDSTGFPQRRVQRWTKRFREEMESEDQATEETKRRAELGDRLISRFRFPEDIGEGDHQVAQYNAEWALDCYDYYNTSYDVIPMLGLVRRYALIAGARPNLTNKARTIYDTSEPRQHERDVPPNRHPFDVVEAARLAECYFYADLVEIVNGEERPNTDYLTLSLIHKSPSIAESELEYMSIESLAERRGIEPFVMPITNDAWFEYMPIHHEIWLEERGAYK